MMDKADAITKRQMKTKISYYFSPLWVKVAILIILILTGRFILHA
ncbi:Uncharacterised protein [uncultured archaeon]|nr:Uncharacterised protein [uncultured archaeon]